MGPGALKPLHASSTLSMHLVTIARLIQSSKEALLNQAKETTKI